MHHMTRRLAITILALAFPTIAIPTIAMADWVSLKNGGRIEGKIIRKSDHEIAIRRKEGGLVTLRRDQIAEFHTTIPTKTDEKKAEPKRVSPPKSKVRYGEVPDRAGNIKHRFDDAQLEVPGTLEKLELPKRRHGEAQVVGRWRDPDTGAMFELTRGPLPLGSEDFEELVRRLRRFYLAAAEVRIDRWERTRLSGQPLLHFEIRRETPRGEETQILQWLEGLPGEVYAITATVATSKLGDHGEKIRTVVRSLRPIAADRPTAE